MQKKRHLPTLCLGLAALAAAPAASALGWDRAPQSAVLGQSLDFNVNLRLDPGDVVESKCVAAEVTTGDTRLPPHAVRVGTDTSAPDLLKIRVVTGPALDEPVASVTVAVGCPARLSRRFVLLLDPPSNAPSALPPASVVADTPPPRIAAAPVVAVAPTAPPAPAPRAETAAPAAPGGADKPAAERAARPAERRPVRKAAPPPPSPKPATTAARLQLDPVEAPQAKVPAAAASAIEDALQAVAQAASAARAAASAASSAESRVAVLEQELNQLRSEAKLNGELAARMKERVAAAESSSRWLTPLLVGAAALAALAFWLAMRLRDANQAKQRAWRAAAAASTAAPRPDIATSQLPMVTSEIMAPPSTHPGHAAGLAPQAPAMAVMKVAPPAAEPPPSAVERTDVLPVGSVAEPGSPRDVSIDELLDLEQQAEFFIVLGQEDAAIDLLVDHLRDTGGGSPLPYLKLLEIYRRRNDREAYERTRARFNHRFNAYAPDWEADLQSGRSLEDYPGVVPRLQQVWGRPLDAMAELEALLFRKSRGQLFDLPAYREVLFLYSLARDLLDRESADSGNVDLLLPLADGSDFGSTSPHPFAALERESVFDSLPEDKPTAPIDLDLSQPETQPPIVDPIPPRRG